MKPGVGLKQFVSAAAPSARGVDAAKALHLIGNPEVRSHEHKTSGVSYSCGAQNTGCSCGSLSGIRRERCSSANRAGDCAQGRWIGNRGTNFSCNRRRYRQEAMRVRFLTWLQETPGGGASIRMSSVRKMSPPGSPGKLASPDECLTHEEKRIGRKLAVEQAVF